MTIVDIVVITLLVGLFWFGLLRNIKVCFFRNNISQVCNYRQIEFIDGSVIPVDMDVYEAWKKEMDKIDCIVDDILAVPYEKMLFSFKPLNVENWYTEEQVKFLRGETHLPENLFVGGTNVDMSTL